MLQASGSRAEQTSKAGEDGKQHILARFRLGGNTLKAEKSEKKLFAWRDISPIYIYI